MSNQACSFKHPDRFWRVKRWFKDKSWWALQPLMSWIAFRLHHTQEPEYYKNHPFLVRWLGGLQAFAWTWVCGHHFDFSFDIANIHWKLFRKGAK